jgi:hypothetical protein
MQGDAKISADCDLEERGNWSWLRQDPWKYIDASSPPKKIQSSPPARITGQKAANQEVEDAHSRMQNQIPFGDRPEAYVLRYWSKFRDEGRGKRPG